MWKIRCIAASWSCVCPLEVGHLIDISYDYFTAIGPHFRTDLQYCVTGASVPWSKDQLSVCRATTAAYSVNQVWGKSLSQQKDWTKE